MTEIKEFIGILRFTPIYAKCDPISIYGHWTLKKRRGAWPETIAVWCNDGLYKHGINETICEIVKIDKIITQAPP